MTTIIGFCGPEMSGKDTCANYLTEKYDFEHRKFATKMRETICALFGITDDDYDEFKFSGLITLDIPTRDSIQVTGRQFLRLLGTEVGRTLYGKDFWVNLALPPGSYIGKKIVISDVRFPNEFKRISDLGGVIVQVVRPGYEYSSEHKSDEPPPYIDIKLLNDDTLEDLYIKLDMLLDDLLIS